MQDYFLQERGIAYRTNGIAPEKKTLLFVHGLSGSLSAWYPYEKIFGQDYNLVTFDLRGHGLSIRPGRSEYAMQEYVEDIRALLAHLHIAHCAVVSHSFGTLIAMEFAKAYPALVDHLIYLAPPYGVHAFRLRRFAANIGAALAVAPLRLRRYGRTDYTSMIPTTDWNLRRIGTDIANMGLRSYLRCLNVVFARDYSRDWAKAAMPALIVHGTRDTLVPVTCGRSLAAALPGSRFVELPEANHILVLNNVEEVARLIREFLGQ